MKSIEQFIQEQGITMHPEPAPANPNADDWARDASHYFCRFFAVKPDSSEGFTTYFSMGSAHTEPPTTADVLDCLASDASSVDEEGFTPSFEDWAAGLGEDEDSRKAERTYNAVKNQTERLREWLGDEVYRDLVWKTERQ